MTDPPLCPTCAQPASEALAGPRHGWECRNEACSEYGQDIAPGESPPRDAPEAADRADVRRRGGRRA